MPDLDTAQDLTLGRRPGTTFVDIINSLITPEQPLRIFDNCSQMLAASKPARSMPSCSTCPSPSSPPSRSDGRLAAVAQLPSSEMIAAAMPKGSGNEQAVDSAMGRSSTTGR